MQEKEQLQLEIEIKERQIKKVRFKEGGYEEEKGTISQRSPQSILKSPNRPVSRSVALEETKGGGYEDLD